MGKYEDLIALLAEMSEEELEEVISLFLLKRT